MDIRILNKLKKEGKGYFGFEPVEFIVLDGGMNNLIYKILDKDNNVCLLKVYENDKRKRLERESEALSYLYSLGFSVPRVIYIDQKDYFGIYSFEKGKPKKAEELSRAEIEGLVMFLIKLEDCRPEYDRFLLVDMPCLKMADYFSNIDSRIDLIEGSLTKQSTEKFVNSFIKNNQVVEFLISQKSILLSEMGKSDLENPLGVKEQVLSQVDFGPHNILFSENKTAVIDFEKFGWDDPLRVVAQFVHHGKTVKMKTDNKKYFIETYFRNTKQKCSDKRFNVVMRAVALDWIGMMTATLTPNRLAHYLNADPNLDKESYILNQVNDIERRMKKYAG